MSGYPDWRHMWDESGPWRPTVDDITTLLTEIDRLRIEPTVSEAFALLETAAARVRIVQIPTEDEDEETAR